MILGELFTLVAYGQLLIEKAKINLGLRVMGNEAPKDLPREELAVVESLGVENFEVIDLSLNQEGRGFDIIGHHYWYRHPWASSDIVLLLRTNLPSHLRGLSPAELEGVFFMSPEYPNEVREATRHELGSRWFGGEKEK